MEAGVDHLVSDLSAGVADPAADPAGFARMRHSSVSLFRQPARIRCDLLAHGLCGDAALYTVIAEVAVPIIVGEYVFNRMISWRTSEVLSSYFT